MRPAYPIQDQVSIVGVGSTGFKRDAGESSELALAVDASIAAIADSGLTSADIDGVVGTSIPSHRMIDALGLEDVVWYTNSALPVGFAVIDAMNAVYSGLCRAVLVYHSMFRSPYWSRAAAADPFRRLVTKVPVEPGDRDDPETLSGSIAYASWASRYLADYGTGKEPFGRIAINSRTNAGSNPLAVRREPLTMEEYLAARMVRTPLCLLDMDIPVDGGDAFVLTSTERALDLPHRPVLVHAACAGIADRTEEDQTNGLRRNGQHVVTEYLRARTELWLDDMDVFYPYDGFTIITIAWLESLGLCGAGEAADFLRENWDDAENRILIGGRVPVNTHGGSLSEGGTQGSGHVREAVVQLRGDAGTRQVPDASVALLTPGGFIYNAQGLVLRTT